MHSKFTARNMDKDNLRADFTFVRICPIFVLFYKNPNLFFHGSVGRVDPDVSKTSKVSVQRVFNLAA